MKIKDTWNEKITEECWKCDVKGSSENGAKK